MSRPAWSPFASRATVPCIEDSLRHTAVALRAAWLEVGGAPYLASLRIDQATNWAQFRTALTYARMPALNWVWGDTSGAIGWQAAGVAPVRPNSRDGLVPVAGDGRYEWRGFLPIAQLPHVGSPEVSAFGTANAFNVPAGYPHVNAVARTWAEPWRLRRLTEVLDAVRGATVGSMARLQHDETAVAARTLVPLLRDIALTGDVARAARDSLLAWNGVLSANSTGAAIYAVSETATAVAHGGHGTAAAARSIMESSLSRTVSWLTSADSILGVNPQVARDFILFRAFNETVQDLSRRFGRDLCRVAVREHCPPSRAHRAPTWMAW